MEKVFTSQCLECLKEDCLSEEIARLTDIVQGMELRMTKGTDRIESDDRERGQKEHCSDKNDRKGDREEGKHMEKEQQETSLAGS